MLALNKILIRNSGRKSPMIKVLQRYLTTLYEKELTVTPFCNVNANLPFNVTVFPLDVHKYANYDKVFIKLFSKDETSTVNLQCDNVNDTINVICNSEELVHDVTCHIEAPVKANINISTQRGNIKLAGFNGDNITLASVSGNISAAKSHCERIYINSSTGNITCTNVIQATEIYLKTGNYGSISTGKLQGLVLTAETENGNIQTQSSYCDNSVFVSKNGHLDLRSTHKNCKVVITDKGLLNMTGFDGSLQVHLKEGNADIQIARIQDNSKIYIEKTGTLILKLFDTCLQNTSFKVFTKNIHMDSDILPNAKTKDGYTVLSCGGETTAEVLVDCQKSNVSVQSASWMEMFNLKLAK